MSEEEANSNFVDELGKCSYDKRFLLLMSGWNVCGEIWADTVKRLLGVTRGDRKRITKVLEREKIDMVAAVTRQRAIYMCPLFWGRTATEASKKKKI